MGPSRKKARTEPPHVDKPPQEQYSPPVELAKDNEANASTPAEVKETRGTKQQLRSKDSWYGTWPRKPIASTQVARPTILADKHANGSTSDLRRFDIKDTLTPTPSVVEPAKDAAKPLDGPADVKTTYTIDKEAKDKALTAEGPLVEASKESLAISTEGVAQTQPLPKQRQEPGVGRPVTASGWFNWLAVPGGRLESDSKAAQIAEPIDTSRETPSGAEQAAYKSAAPPPDSLLLMHTTKEISARTTSWFGRWSTVPPSVATEQSKEDIPSKVETQVDTVMTDAPSQEDGKAPAAGSSWAFWSTEIPKRISNTAQEGKDSGQLAVAGDASQSQPEPAKATTITGKKGKSIKRGRPISMEEQPAKSTLPERSPTRPTSASPAPSKPAPPNLLLPSVRSTYNLVENPSIIQQIARLLNVSHQLPAKHVFVAKEKPRIQKALAIGIHGLFPATIVRTVIGQPTGTSIKFANHAAAAIRRWTDAHGCTECEIEKAALEGEGKISERVDNLWKLLLNWIDHVRNADFILVACHSQGVPVAIMLVAKLIEFGVVTNAKIGVCAMAGVSLGPFADYKSRFFGGSAAELFEFANPESVVSMRYTDALRIVLKYGVRVTYCGSIDDQVISMESSIFATASHPYLYRAVFVDGRIHTPDFLAHLVGFALKLRNLGVSDHGLIRELSAPLAGSLYTGEGHSRLYDEAKVYDLAIEYALETTSVGEVPLEIKRYEAPTSSNPYVLPWIMRGLLEEDFVKTELHTEVTELLKQFDEWKPATKVLKDVKYRLEAVRSKT